MKTKEILTPHFTNTIPSSTPQNQHYQNILFFTLISSNPKKEKDIDEMNLEEIADAIGLSKKEKKIRLRMDQEEKILFLNMNKKQLLSRLPTSKVWKLLNDKEKSEWIK